MSKLIVQYPTMLSNAEALQLGRLVEEALRGSKYFPLLGQQLLHQGCIQEMLREELESQVLVRNMGIQGGTIEVSYSSAKETTLETLKKRFTISPYLLEKITANLEESCSQLGGASIAVPVFTVPPPRYTLTTWGNTPSPAEILEHLSRFNMKPAKIEHVIAYLNIVGFGPVELGTSYILGQDGNRMPTLRTDRNVVPTRTYSISEVSAIEYNGKTVFWAVPIDTP